MKRSRLCWSTSKTMSAGDYTNDAYAVRRQKTRIIQNPGDIAASSRSDVVNRWNGRRIAESVEGLGLWRRGRYDEGI